MFITDCISNAAGLLNEASHLNSLGQGEDALKVLLDLRDVMNNPIDLELEAEGQYYKPKCPHGGKEL